MPIAARDSSGRIFCIPAPESDQLLFFGYFVSIFFAVAIKHLPRPNEKLDGPELFISLVGIPFLYLIAFLVILLTLEVVAFVKLRSVKAISLQLETSNPFSQALKRESERVGLPQRKSPSVFWIPSSYRVSARVFGGITPKLLISGGLYATVAKARPEALCVLRHELAHLKNGDTGFYTILMLLCALPMLFGLSGHDAMMVTLSLALNVFITIFLLRRREYIADAMALNATASEGVYEDFLARAATGEGGLFHPSASSRVKALGEGSPVLSFSVALVSLSTIWILGSLKLIFLVFPDQSLPDIPLGTFYLFTSTVLAFLALIFEIAKGFRKKVPALVGQYGTAMEPSGFWIASLCSMNAWWWFLTLLLRFRNEIWSISELEASSPRFQQNNQGIMICVAISLAWLITGYGLVRKNRWARHLGLGLSAASIAWQFYEFLNKDQKLSWFGWYEKREDYWHAAFCMLLLTFGNFVMVFIGLLRKRTRDSFANAPQRDPWWFGYAFVGVAIAIVAVTLSMPGLFALKLPPESAGQETIPTRSLSSDSIHDISDDLTQNDGVVPGAATDDEPVTVRSQTMEGSLIHRVEPVYPVGDDSARSSHAALLAVTIGKDGTVREIQAIRGKPAFVHAAIEAVNQWRYKPYLLDEEPVIVRTTVTVTFLRK